MVDMTTFQRTTVFTKTPELIGSDYAPCKWFMEKVNNSARKKKRIRTYNLHCFFVLTTYSLAPHHHLNTKRMALYRKENKLQSVENANAIKISPYPTPHSPYIPPFSNETDE